MNKTILKRIRCMYETGEAYEHQLFSDTVMDLVKLVVSARITDSDKEYLLRHFFLKLYNMDDVIGAATSLEKLEDRKK